MPHEAVSARTSSGKAIDSRCSAWCQSSSTCTSRRGEPARSDVRQRRPTTGRTSAARAPTPTSGPPLDDVDGLGGEQAFGVGRGPTTRGPRRRSGRAGRRPARAPRPSWPAGSSSRAWATSMIEVRLPARSHDTARRPLVIERSVTTTWSSAATASAGAMPETRHPGPERRAPVGQRLHRSVAGRRQLADDHLVAVDGRRRWRARHRSARVDRSEVAIRDSRSAAMRAWAASASAWTQAIDEPGMMSWNCWVSTSATGRRARGGHRRRPHRRTSTARPRAAAARSAGCRPSCAAGW